MWMANDTNSVTVHLTDFFAVQPNATDLARFASGDTTPEESAYIVGSNEYMTEDYGCLFVQATRPLALALAMSDSPVGFAGWEWQLMHTANDAYEYCFSDLITTTMMLFIQGTYGSFRTYKEFAKIRFISSLWPCLSFSLGVMGIRACSVRFGSQVSPRSRRQQQRWAPYNGRT
jgi:hypothetical protein